MPRKLTQKEASDYFKAMGFELLTTYNGSTSKVLVRCMEGDKFETTYKNINKTPKCPVCKQREQIKYVKDELKKRGFLLISDYKGYDNPIKVMCSNKHIVSMTFDNIIKGNGCKICGRKVLPSYEYIQEFIESFGYKLLSNAIVNATHKFWVECPKKHIYDVNWNKFSSGRRCPYCQNKVKLSYEEVQSIFAKYGYEIIGEYKNTITPVLVRCPKGHEYQVTFGNFNSGKRCGKCGNNSKGELKINNILVELNIDFKTQYTFKNCKNIFDLFFDFYLPQYNLCIEYDGEQHFKPVEVFGGEDGFVQTVVRDAIKNQYCEDNHINIVRIPYWDFENIKEIIITKINNLK